MKEKEKELFDFVKENNIQKAEKLLKDGVDANAREFSRGTRILHYAKTGEAAKMLIDNGAEVNAKSRDDTTPLHEAVRRNLPEVVSVLLENGAEVNEANSIGEIPLHLTNSSETTKLLVEHGSEINAADSREETPLFKISKLSVFEILIKAGADITIRNWRGETVLHSIIPFVMDSEPVDAEPGKEQGKRKRSDGYQIIERLIEMGLDVNGKDKDYKTPLFIAARRNQTAIIKLLIDNKAEVNTKDKYGNTPLHETKSKKTAALLLKHGADINAKNEYGETPLHKSNLEDNIELSKYLIESGADVNSIDEGMNSGTPVFSVKSPEMLKLMIENNADINMRDSSGQTLLHEFVQKTEFELVKILLEYNVNINAKDNKGRTPLFYASVLDIVEALIKAGALTNIGDKYGKKPADFFKGRYFNRSLKVDKEGNITVKRGKYDI